MVRSISVVLQLPYTRKFGGLLRRSVLRRLEWKSLALHNWSAYGLDGELRGTPLGLETI